MRRMLFRSLARVNRALLPKLGPHDLARMDTLRKLLLAWRYWVTRNAL